MQKDFWY